MMFLPVSFFRPRVVLIKACLSSTSESPHTQGGGRRGGGVMEGRDGGLLSAEGGGGGGGGGVRVDTDETPPC